jgi:hypothetical protein
MASNLPCRRIQVDEIWSFTCAKAKNVPTAKAAPVGAGDTWTWTAICADTKLVPCWLVGPRDGEYALAFIDDLRQRLAARVQLTSDGLKAYLDAVEESFGDDIDYAMLVKLYGPDADGPANSAQRKYSPGHCTGTREARITGNPDPKHISTSYAERTILRCGWPCVGSPDSLMHFQRSWPTTKLPWRCTSCTTTSCASTRRSGSRPPWQPASRIGCGRSRTSQTSLTDARLRSGHSQMLTQALLLAAIFTLAMPIDGYAQSQQPATSQPSQQGTKQQERGSDSADQGPIGQKTTESQEPENKVQHENAAEHRAAVREQQLVDLTSDLADYTLYLFIATAILALATAGLVIVGFCQLRDSKHIIRAANQSASVAERALTDLERPHVFFKRVYDSGLVIQANGAGRQKGHLRLAFVNRGRSVAVLLAIRHNLRAFPNGQMPPPANPAADAGDTLPTGVVIAADNAYVFPIDPLTSVSVEDLKLGTSVLWLWGFLRYASIMNRRYVVGFCARLDLDAKRFVLYGGDEYNYTRTEEIPAP